MATKTTKKPATKATPAKTVAAYIAAAPKDRRAALTTIRRTIKAAAPKAVEKVSYGIVGYKQGGKTLVYFGNWKDHYGVYGLSGSVLDAHAAELKGYVMSKGTIQFPADEPVPVTLVTKLVKTRLAELEQG